MIVYYKEKVMQCVCSNVFNIKCVNLLNLLKIVEKYVPSCLGCAEEVIDDY